MMDIEAKEVTARFGRNTVLDAVNITIRPGQMIGLIGPNGSGKTTLLRLLAGLRRPESGLVLYNGRSASDIGRRQLARTIAYLAQVADVHWHMQVEYLIELGRLPHRRMMQGPGAADRQAVERAIEACDVGAFRARTMSEVSGGERLRILLARALAVEAELLLADEPIAGLDPRHQLQVMDLLRQTARNGRGVVVVLHDLALAGRYCDRLVLLTDRRIIADGAPSEVLTDFNIAQAHGVVVVRGEHCGIPYLLPWQLKRAASSGALD
jgi:iron complex transport system ATP-binding protein